MLEVCLKPPVIGLHSVAGDKMHTLDIRLIAFILDLIYGMTCFKGKMLSSKYMCLMLQMDEKRKQNTSS